jgi:hypothetical protein
LGLLIQAAVGSAGGFRGRLTKRSGVAAYQTGTPFKWTYAAKVLKVVMV